jgi:hypothetical protein
MTTSSSSSSYPIASATTVDHRTSATLWAGLISGVLAAVAATVVAVVAEAAGVPMMAAPASASAGEHIPLAAYAISTLPSAAIGVLLALAFARWAPRPAATFVVVTVVLTILSFALPATTSFATTGTRLVLALTHIVAAAIIIPALARTLPAENTRREAAH